MHIELIGMSGVGKSTIIKQLLKTKKYTNGRNLLYRKDIRGVLLRREVTLGQQHQVEFENRFNNLVCFFLTHFEKNNGVNWLNYLNRINWVMSTAKAYMLSIENTDRPVIIDESFLHRGLAFTEFDEKFLYSYLHHVPMPNYLIILEADREVILQRRFKRDGASFEKLIKDKGENWFYEHINLINSRIDLIEKYSTKKGVKVIRLNTSNNLKNLIDSINELVFK